MVVCANKSSFITTKNTLIALEIDNLMAKVLEKSGVLKRMVDFHLISII